MPPMLILRCDVCIVQLNCLTLLYNKVRILSITNIKFESKIGLEIHHFKVRF